MARLAPSLPRALRGRAPGRELSWARGGTVALLAIAAAFALYSPFANARRVALLGVFGAATFAAALVPVVAIGLGISLAQAPPRLPPDIEAALEV